MPLTAGKPMVPSCSTFYKLHSFLCQLADHVIASGLECSSCHFAQELLHILDLRYVLATSLFVLYVKYGWLTMVRKFFVTW